MAEQVLKAIHNNSEHRPAGSLVVTNNAKELIPLLSGQVLKAILKSKYLKVVGKRFYIGQLKIVY